MPTRILREGIISSEKVNSLTEPAELFYRKIHSIADDYGRFYANPVALLGACYPLRPSVTVDQVQSYIKECSDLGLIVVYGQGRYIQVTNFRQQTRSASKFPEPVADELLIICEATSVKPKRLAFSLDVGGGGGGGEGGSASPVFSEIPSWKEFWEFCQSPHCGIGAEWFARDKFDAQEAAGWERIKDWRKHALRVRGWWDNAGRPSKPTGMNGKIIETKKKLTYQP